MSSLKDDVMLQTQERKCIYKVLSVKNTMIDYGDDGDKEEEQTAVDSCKQCVSPSSEHSAAARSENSK